MKFFELFQLVPKLSCNSNEAACGSLAYAA